VDSIIFIQPPIPLDRPVPHLLSDVFVQGQSRYKLQRLQAEPDLGFQGNQSLAGHQDV